MANMYGMVLARYKLCPEVKKTGLSGSTPLAAFVSSDVSKELSVLCPISGQTHQIPEGLIKKFHNEIVDVNYGHSNVASEQLYNIQESFDNPSGQFQQYTVCYAIL